MSTDNPARRWVVWLAPAAAVILVAASVGVWWWTRDRADAERRAWQPPPEPLLSSSMAAPPVPGWRTTVTDLGLPPGGSITVNRGGVRMDPFVGHLGDHAYFLATTTEEGRQRWWLAGVDVRAGTPLFPAIALGAASTSAPECFLNGPTMVLCLRRAADGHVAWVIDDAAGTIRYTGPTELKLASGPLKVNQVGIYAVAGTTDEGLYGIGPHAEPTWFVPGVGSPDPGFRYRSTFNMPPLATQTTWASRKMNKVVFSLVDGSILGTPDDPDIRPLDAMVHPEGFAVEIATTSSESLSVDEIWFFDASGDQVGRVDFRGGLAMNSPDMPVGWSTQGWTVFTTEGRPLAELPATGSLAPARLIGTRLFVAEKDDSAFPQWTQYDLRTGEQGKTCEFNIRDYLGTDGEVAVLDVNNPGAPVVLRAADPTTCEILWRLPKQPDSLGRVWRAKTTLIRLSDDATELMSLVAP